MTTNRLTDVEVRRASFSPGPRRQRVWDGGGLYLEVTKSGGRLWRLKYRFAGREKLLALGAYPDGSPQIIRMCFCVHPLTSFAMMTTFTCCYVWLFA